MPVQITIIGLGQVGTSVGLALAEHPDKLTRYGHDIDPSAAKHAQEMGALDKTFFNLPASVESADIVLLALPLDQIRSTLQVIGPCLQENAVVMDTAPGKQAVAQWAGEFLPAKRHYVGLLPAFNPVYLGESQGSPHADLFTKGLMAIVAPAGTVGAAIKLATDLSILLGAAPFFIDMEEADGIMTALQTLPQLSAAAVANMNIQRPGWKDARKLAGSVFYRATSLADYEDETFVETILQNRTNVVRVLDELMDNLGEVRELVDGEHREELARWVENARQGRSAWWQERSAGDWQALEMEKLGLSKKKRGIWKRMFGDVGKWFAPPTRPGGGEENK